MTADDIGFPASQLLANGLPLETAKKVSDAFWMGKSIKGLLTDTDLTPPIDSIIERLDNHSARGKGIYEQT